MSLAMYAAPFDDKTEDGENVISDKKKQQSRNKTLKKYPKENFDQQKVNSILEKIHNDSKEDDEENSGNNLGDYYNNPPPKPESIGAQRTVATEQMQTMFFGKTAQPSNGLDDKLDMNNFQSNYLSADDYYSKHLPGYRKGDAAKSVQSHGAGYINRLQYAVPVDSSNDILLKKINYMINLLEESQDERTNNVTEEVVLYSFLGIFIIFVVDSFARVGKYVR